MNNLMSKKKKYRFQVELRVEELQHVPFLCQELYVKCRLLNGGFTHHSQSLMVENHCVRWDETFKFCSKMTAKASTGELDSCICRVSVRQEMKGGRSYQKLGYADVNLAQFAGSGGTNCYLLEAYDSKHRLHNSTLKVTVDMTLLSGDPCFKAQPWPSQPPIIDGPHESSKKPDTGSVGSVASLGYNSLDKNSKATEDLEIDTNEQVGHSRNSSNTSGSGYVSNASQSDRSGGHAREEKPEYHYMTIEKMKYLLLKRTNSFLSKSSASHITSPTNNTLKSLNNPDLISTCCVCNNMSLQNARNLTLNSSYRSSNLLLEVAEFDKKSYDAPAPRLSISEISSFHRLSSYSCSTYSRSGSQGSAVTGSDGGSLERTLVSSGSRTKSSVHSDSSKDPRLVSTREDPQDMVNQIFQDTIGTIKPSDCAETPPGLQLYIRQDGTASFSGSAIRSKPIIINKR